VLSTRCQVSNGLKEKGSPGQMSFVSAITDNSESHESRQQ